MCDTEFIDTILKVYIIGIIVGIFLIIIRNFVYIICRIIVNYFLPTAHF